MSYQSRKGNEEIVHFEDKNYPAFLRDIESKYWYRCKGTRLDKRTRKYITYKEINSGKGLEIIHEKDTDRYFYHVPIEEDWFPDDDIRNENQISRSEEGNESESHRRIISLDPGVRKFLVGYDYRGEVIFVGEGANKRMIELLLETNEDYRNPKLWRKIKNYVSELHNKVVKFLVSNYDEIILPEFRVSEMMRGKRLSRMTKRLLNMFSFWKFRDKLENRCLREGKKLYIVDESFTSKTCGNCGNLKDMKGEEVYKCEECGIEIDRDVNGARNIFLKNMRPLR
jgi:IS605 OrfB family transposase